MNVNRQYIGARYVPIFYENPRGGNDWLSGVRYDALTIVTYLNQSYTSKKVVPNTVGNPKDNPEYWVMTADYNAQVEGYRQEVAQALKDVDASEAEYKEQMQNQYNGFTSSTNNTVNQYKNEIDQSEVDFKNKLDAKYNAQQQQINDLVLNAGSEEASSAEIAQARDGYNTLNDRLNKMLGYAKNVEYTDFNALPTGWWFIETDQIKTMDNSPSKNFGGLYVLCCNLNSSMFQFATNYRATDADRRVWIRVNSGSWSKWTALIGTNNVHNTDVDFDKYIEAGTWYINTVNEYTNAPFNTEGLLTVYRASNSILIQIYIGRYFGQWFRTSSNNGNTWSTWSDTGYFTYPYISGDDDLNNYFGYNNIRLVIANNNLTNSPVATNARGVLMTIHENNFNVEYQLFFEYSGYWIRNNLDKVWRKTTPEALIRNDNTILDANDFENGFVAIETDNLNKYTNLPDTNVGVIVLTMRSGIHSIVQLAFSYASSKPKKEWLRVCSQNWSDWIVISSNANELPNDANFDDYKEGKYYYITDQGGTNLPFPRTYGGFLIADKGTNFSLQRYYTLSTGFEYAQAVRPLYDGRQDTPWYIIHDRPRRPSMGFVCIVDSLGSGTIQDDDGSTSVSNSYEQSWGKHLADKLGWTFYISGRAGLSTREWLNSEERCGVSMLANLPTVPLYFIGLGANDVNQNVPQTEYVDNYKLIIERIKAIQPGAVIMCCATARDNLYKQYDTAMKTMVEGDYGDFKTSHVAYFDVSEKIKAEPISSQLIGSHYTWYGYKLIADAMYEKLTEFFTQYPKVFDADFSKMMLADDPAFGFPAIYN